MTLPTSHDSYLDSCDREPLAFIGQIQPQGYLLILKQATLSILQVSENIHHLTDTTHVSMVGRKISAFFSLSFQDWLDRLIQDPENLPFQTPFHQKIKGKTYEVIAHLKDALLFIELTPLHANEGSVLERKLLTQTIEKIHRSTHLSQLTATTAQELKTLTGYDRVMIYRFDEEWNGEVIEEAKEPHLSPYAGLRYPASDIPPKAREIYRTSWVRLIGNTTLEQVPIYPKLNPLTHQSTDLATVTLRAVSPIHIEYLHNMGVGASMSIAITINDKLWGLIACHHGEARWVSHEVRRACVLVGQVFSGHMTMILSKQALEEKGDIQLIRAHLHQQVTHSKNLVKALTDSKYSLLDLVACHGAAIRMENRWHTLGLTPSEDELNTLLTWIPDQLEEGFWVTDRLGNSINQNITHPYVGLLAIEISRKTEEYIFWFKPEQVMEVSWGGKPEKIAVQTESGLRLHPRKSFAKWTEVVRGRSTPWRPFEIQAARELRENIISTIIQDFGEQKALNLALQNAISDLQTFSYSVSHDLRAPLRNIDGFAEILLEEYQHILDSDGKELLEAVSDSAKKMNTLIDDILVYARIGQVDILHNPIKLRSLIDDVIQQETRFLKQDEVEIEIQPLPLVHGDRTLLRQLFVNLISNALKYSRFAQPSSLTIGGENRGEYVQIFVKDNGIGLDERLQEKVFKLFTRLVPEDTFEGTGVGLAIAHRIIEKHQGEIWVESQLGKGATFIFTLPHHYYGDV